MRVQIFFCRFCVSKLTQKRVNDGHVSVSRVLQFDKFTGLHKLEPGQYIYNSQHNYSHFSARTKNKHNLLLNILTNNRCAAGR